MTKAVFLTWLIAFAVLAVILLVDGLLEHSGWSFVLVLFDGGASVTLVRHYASSRSR